MERNKIHQRTEWAGEWLGFVSLSKMSLLLINKHLSGCYRLDEFPGDLE